MTNDIDRVASPRLALIRRAVGAWAGLAFLSLATPACAHDFRLGPLVIDHPYAIPTPAGSQVGAVFFRTLMNTGAQPDRLVAARSANAASVEIQRGILEGGVTRARSLPSLDLPPGAELKLRHDGDIRLALIDLKAPLQDGQCFPLWLRFERAGEREVKVCVQTPRGRMAHPH